MNRVLVGYVWEFVAIAVVAGGVYGFRLAPSKFELPSALQCVVAVPLLMLIMAGLCQIVVMMVAVMKACAVLPNADNVVALVFMALVAASATAGLLPGSIVGLIYRYSSKE